MKEVGSRTNRRTLWFSLVLATAILVGAGIALGIRAQSVGQVEGYVFAKVQDRQMPLSGITVYVENVSTSTQSQKVKTDLNGRFVVPDQPAGTYQLCWEAPGFVAECESVRFVIDNGAVFLSPVEITPEGGVISGRVTLADGTPCHYSDPFFGVDVSTSVALIDSADAEVAGPVLADASGDYLLTSVPSGTFRLRAACEAVLAEERLTTSETGTVVKDLTFESHRPVVSDVVATLDGKPVQSVPKGTMVEITANATDADGDPLHYKWATQVPGLTSEDSPTIQWTLPKSGGLHTLYVLVSDGKGGYQMGRVEISTDEGLVFSHRASALSTSLVTSSDPDCITSPNLPSCKVQTNFLTFNGIDSKESACKYYEAIGAIVEGDKKCDPNSISQPKGITFSRWKGENGLRVNPDANNNGNLFDDDNITGEASALYLNAVDLDLGRSMHGKKSAVNGVTTVAYYVCNYPTLQDARNDTNQIACVAMDYTSDKSFNKFYIFGSGGDLRIGVDLDKRGVKYVPGTCTVCHGANDAQARQPFTGNADVGGHFLPFDLDNFGYVPNSITFSRRAQESKFRKLNQLILSTKTINPNDPDDPAPVVKQLIAGWYPNGKDPQLSGFVPSGWKDKNNPSIPFPLSTESWYLNVVKRSCRTCHVVMRPRFNFNRFANLENDDPATPPDDRKGSFKDRDAVNDKINAILIRGHVCSAYDMPNSKVTFNRFWQSSDSTGIGQPEFLVEFLDASDDGMVNDSVKCPDPRTLP